MYFFRRKILSILIFTGIIAGESSIAFARWATYNDADSEIVHTKRNIFINKDGRNSEIYEIQLKLLKERAKPNWAQYIYGYNSYEQAVNILEAYTLTNGQKYPVNLHAIKKHAVSQDLQTLNENTQIIVPYPKLKVGSTIYLKSKTDFIPVIKNYHSAYLTFGNQYYTRSASAYIRSELPLHISINDPDKRLWIKQSKKKIKSQLFYFLEIHQKKPIYKNIVNEDAIHFNLKHVPAVFVAAMPTRTHYGEIIASEYTKIKNQTLPLLYKDIANSAKEKYSTTEKINTVMDLLQKNITYLMNPKYTFFPQSLQKTADTKYGDCKDFSVATCTILQAIGISSKVAFVNQGEMVFAFPSNLPGSGINHAIVKVELPEGPLWIDPTDKAAKASYTSPHISNRKAFVLHENYATDEYIPSTKSQDCRLIKRETWNMRAPELIHIKGNIEIIGNASGMFKGINKGSSAEDIKDLLLSSVIRNDYEIVNYDIKLPNVKSQAMEDLSVDYNMTIKSSTEKSYHTMLLSLKSARLLMTKKGAVSALYLGTPRIYETYITLQNPDFFKEVGLNFEIQSPWADLSRSINYDMTKDEVLIHKKIEIKKTWIEDTELVSDAYKQLQLSLSQNFQI